MSVAVGAGAVGAGAVGDRVSAGAGAVGDRVSAVASAGESAVKTTREAHPLNKEILNKIAIKLAMNLPKEEPLFNCQECTKRVLQACINYNREGQSSLACIQSVTSEDISVLQTDYDGYTSKIRSEESESFWKGFCNQNLGYGPEEIHLGIPGIEEMSFSPNNGFLGNYRNQIYKHIKETALENRKNGDCKGNQLGIILLGDREDAKQLKKSERLKHVKKDPESSVDLEAVAPPLTEAFAEVEPPNASGHVLAFVVCREGERNEDKIYFIDLHNRRNSPVMSKLNNDYMKFFDKKIYAHCFKDKELRAYDDLKPVKEKPRAERSSPPAFAIPPVRSSETTESASPPSLPLFHSKKVPFPLPLPPLQRE